MYSFLNKNVWQNDTLISVLSAPDRTLVVLLIKIWKEITGMDVQFGVGPFCLTLKYLMWALW